MAVTRFLGPLLIVFLGLISRHKWLRTVQVYHMDQQGNKEFMFCTPLAPKEAVALGYEVLYRVCRANNLNGSRLCLKNASSLFYILLLLGGDIELNPGDKWPSCGMCSNQVKSNQEGFQCDQCNVWFHMNCRHMPNEMCNVLKNSSFVWICPQCDKPNQLNASLYDSLDSLCSENAFKPLNRRGLSNSFANSKP